MAMRNNRIQVMLADDQEIIRQGLRYIINAQPDMVVVGEAANSDEAICVSTTSEADVVLMDIRMPGRTGIEATRAILNVRPNTKVILLTTFDIPEYIYDGIRAGAVGYLLKDADTRTLLDGIRAAHRGAVIYRSESSARAISKAMESGVELAPPGNGISPTLEPLTQRELEVLQQMALGRRTPQIAAFLSISEGTVKTHVHRILQKFQVEDRTQAVVLAIRQKMVR
jgi:DNA-binding NarL/FixJ family response regulator